MKTLSEKPLILCGRMLVVLPVMMNISGHWRLSNVVTVARSLLLLPANLALLKMLQNLLAKKALLSLKAQKDNFVTS